jgi:hypothetical protein
MKCNLSAIPTISELECIILVFIKNLLAVGGIIFFFMLINGGFKYLTSEGSQEKVLAAHKTLTYAIFGLLASVLSYTVLLLIEYLTGAKVTEFKFSFGN